MSEASTLPARLWLPTLIVRAPGRSPALAGANAGRHAGGGAHRGQSRRCNHHRPDHGRPGHWAVAAVRRHRPGHPGRRTTGARRGATCPERTIPLGDIRSLERRRDPARNGALIGAGVGAGIGLAQSPGRRRWTTTRSTSGGRCTSRSVASSPGSGTGRLGDSPGALEAAHPVRCASRADHHHSCGPHAVAGSGHGDCGVRPGFATEGRHTRVGLDGRASTTSGSRARGSGLVRRPTLSLRSVTTR